ncbi:MAG: GYD domain-containing protein [Actinobacteria bacterium]|nr:GYD domain-containing protein [Actinomycetota bacterium]
MPIYVMLTKLTEQGANTINRDAGRIKEVNKDVEDLGASILAQYALLGEEDFLNILEAPDNETIMRISLKLASRGTLRIKTVAAMPVDDFIRNMK